MKRIAKFLTVGACAVFALNTYAQEKIDSVYCQKNQTVYQLRYKNESKTGEFTPETFAAWRNVFMNCPTQSKNMYYPHGTTMFSTLYKKEKDAAKKKAYLDTIMMIYDKRIASFGEESNYIGKKGADLYLLDNSQYAQAYEYCRKSVDAMGNNAEPKTMYVCMQTAVTKFQKKEMEKGDVILLYQKIRDVFDFNMAKYKDNEKKYTPFEKILPTIDQLFLSIKPDCNDLIALFEPQFNANPTDAELLKKITENLGKECASSELYFKAAIELDKIEPSAQSKRAIGDMYVAKRQISQAINYYKESIEMEEDASKKAYTYYKMAYNTSGATAVGYANKALSLNPNLGSAYLVIANKYAESASSCSSGAEYPELEKWKVYWLAYDMCQKAKAADPSIASQANSSAASFKSHFPDTESLFGYNVTAGSSQIVGCWINATTTAKVK